jgi:tRNA(Ile)-lysidine synthase
VVCAVSGGADSLALLVLACEAGLQVTAIHVDHGLREGSASEAEVVRAAAARFGASFEARTAEVDAGPNLEARARAARFAVLPAGALTGHTADDQAETLLLNLLRGSGLDGLAGMRHGATKPLLGLRRRETAALCASVGLEPVCDPSNLDPRHRRNRVRHEVMPVLDAVADRDVAALVARQSPLLWDEIDLLEELAGAIDPTDAGALAGAPPALARRAVRRWLAPSLGGYPPDAGAVERVLAVARGHAKATDVGLDVRVTRSRGRLGVTLRPAPSSAALHGAEPSSLPSS